MENISFREGEPIELKEFAQNLETEIEKVWKKTFPNCYQSLYKLACLKADEKEIFALEPGVQWGIPYRLTVQPQAPQAKIYVHIAQQATCICLHGEKISEAVEMLVPWSDSERAQQLLTDNTVLTQLNIPAIVTAEAFVTWEREGQSYLSVLSTHIPHSTGELYDRERLLAATQLVEIVSELHTRGKLLFDLSLENFRFSRDPFRLRLVNKDCLIDFDGDEQRVANLRQMRKAIEQLLPAKTRHNLPELARPLISWLLSRLQDEVLQYDLISPEQLLAGARYCSEQTNPNWDALDEERQAQILLHDRPEESAEVFAQDWLQLQIGSDEPSLQLLLAIAPRCFDAAQRRTLGEKLKTMRANTSIPYATICILNCFINEQPNYEHSRQLLNLAGLTLTKSENECAASVDSDVAAAFLHHLLRQQLLAEDDIKPLATALLQRTKLPAPNLKKCEGRLARKIPEEHKLDLELLALTLYWESAPPKRAATRLANLLFKPLHRQWATPPILRCLCNPESLQDGPLPSDAPEALVSIALAHLDPANDEVQAIVLPLLRRCKERLMTVSTNAEYLEKADLPFRIQALATLCDQLDGANERKCFKDLVHKLGLHKVEDQPQYNEVIAQALLNVDDAPLLKTCIDWALALIANEKPDDPITQIVCELFDESRASLATAPLLHFLRAYQMGNAQAADGYLEKCDQGIAETLVAMHALQANLEAANANSKVLQLTTSLLHCCTNHLNSTESDVGLLQPSFVGMLEDLSMVSRLQVLLTYAERFAEEGLKPLLEAVHPDQDDDPSQLDNVCTEMIKQFSETGEIEPVKKSLKWALSLARGEKSEAKFHEFSNNASPLRTRKNTMTSGEESLSRSSTEESPVKKKGVPSEF